MALVDHKYYVEAYGGTTLNCTDFDTLEPQAERRVYMLTYHRVGPTGPDIEPVKMAICAIVETMHKHSQSEEMKLSLNGVKSATVGPASMSFSDSATVEFKQEQDVRKAAECFLMPTGLMDRWIGGKRCNDFLEL